MRVVIDAGRGRSMMTEWFAHSANAHSRRHLLREHLSAVSSLAAAFAAEQPWNAEARLAGLLHDLGKYGDLFQARLRGETSGIDHWSAGAWESLQQCRCVAAAMAVEGHHLGLQRLSQDSLRALDPKSLAENHPLGLRISENRLETLMNRFARDGLHITSPVSHLLGGIPGDHQLGWMVDLRLLFSALVDADFLDTEAHFEGTEDGKKYRDLGPDLEPARALEALEQARLLAKSHSKARLEVVNMRDDLWRACLGAAVELPGLFTLSAPTGSGKTLAMLAFALAHAKEHWLRRVVVVIPYLTIIEQTAEVYRGAFSQGFSNAFVLEHHSLAGGAGSRDGDSSEGRWERLLAENWDAPIVVTTSVQLLESLFSNRPSACRKLHRLAESVILLDEVQTLPLPLAVPTLAALSHLSSRCRSTVVFATATQPAFDHLDREVRRWVSTGWAPTEIVPPEVGLFKRLRRVDVRWPDPGAPTSWEQLLQELRDREQALVVVNVKRQARDLACRLAESGDGVFHLSTAMCPAHRHSVLAEVRRRLGAEERCVLVSTQCVEAGVDLDFPVVYRAFGPLEAIAQAAGRCNREGRRASGTVVVFLPEEEVYPKDPSYVLAASAARSLLIQLGPAGMDIHDPSLFRRYFERLYSLANPGELRRELQAGIRTYDFPEVDRRYRLIPRGSLSILVPYAEEIDKYKALATEVHATGLRAAWMRRAQPLVVSLFRPTQDDLIWEYLAPLPLKGGGSSAEWFVHVRPEGYDPMTGLMSPAAPEVWQY